MMKKQTLMNRIKRFAIPEDLIPDKFPEIEWKPDNIEESVEKVFRYTVNEAEKSWRFYFDRRRSKRLLGRLILLAMIVTGSAAVIIPIVGEIYKSAEGIPWIAPGWASIALAVAAFFGAVDRFGDFSSGRARYLVTGQKIFRDLETFRFDWEKSKLEREGKSPDMETALLLVEKCKVFHEHVSETIRQEIDQWKKEFKNSLSDKAGLPKDKE